MSNSSLVNFRVMSPNHSGVRKNPIDIIFPHCVVGQLTAKSIGYCFKSPIKRASCNYGIGTEGKVVLVVDEANRSWCSSSSKYDNRAVTIECASDNKSPYAFNTTVYNKLIDLCVDICKRNGKKKLIWISDKKKALAYTPASDEMQLMVHRWFANKSCPGDWLFSRMGELASTVTSKLGGSTSYTQNTQSTQSTQSKKYKVGDIIKLKAGATYYNGKTIPTWVFKSTLYYRGKNANGVVFSTKKTGAVTGIVKPDSIA